MAGSYGCNTYMASLEMLLISKTELNVEATAHCNADHVAEFIQYKVSLVNNPNKSHEYTIDAANNFFTVDDMKDVQEDLEMVPVGQGLMGKRKKSKRACVVRPRQLSGEGKRDITQTLSAMPHFTSHMTGFRCRTQTFGRLPLVLSISIRLRSSGGGSASSTGLNKGPAWLLNRKGHFFKRSTFNPAIAAEPNLLKDLRTSIPCHFRQVYEAGSGNLS